MVADGWRLLATNYRAGDGELDLVAERGGVLRFVEVKARTGEPDGGLSAVSARKQRRLRTAAEHWLGVHGTPAGEVAFCVALVALDVPGWPIDWWDDPF